MLGCPALDLVCAGPAPARAGRALSSSVPRSFVREARKRVGPKKQRIRPIIERLAVEHADAAIALTFASPLELLDLGDALRADDRRERQQGHRDALQKYTKPEDYLAVPQEELERDIFATGFYRQKAKSLRGTMRMLLEEFDGEVPQTLDELVRLPGSRARRRTSSRRSSATRRASSSTRTCAGSRSGSASRSRRIR